MWDSWWDYMEFADVAIWKVHPTSTGRLMAFKLSQLHLGCFFFFLFLFCFSLWSLLSESVFQKPQIRLALLVVQLMRLMRKDSVIAFPKWVSFKEEIAHLHAPTNIPQLLESIDCLIKKIPQQKQGYDFILKPCFGFLLKWFTSCLPPLDAQDPTKWMWLSFRSTCWWMFTRCYGETMSSFFWTLWNISYLKCC